MMKYTNKSLLAILLLSSFAYGKEISVFGAGNLESSSPYGLSRAEKAVLQNNEKLNGLSSKIDALELKLGSFESKQDEVSQRVEGIKSVYESDSQNINSTKLKIKSSENKFEEQANALSLKIDENSKKIVEISTKLDDFITLQKKNNKLLEDSNLKLLTIINKINGEYVKKVEFDELVAFINKNSVEQVTAPTPKKQENQVVESVEKPKVDKKSDKELFDEGLKLFKSNQMSKAMPIFEQLVETKYKPAESNFYFAETKFIKKEYKEAIQSYKQSMIANDKAEYIPKLLFHSAISFENLKQKENAINFYKTIIEVYPESQEAKDAAKKLKGKEDSVKKDDTKEIKKADKKTKSKEKSSKDSKKDVKKSAKKTKESSKDKETKTKKKDKE